MPATPDHPRPLSTEPDLTHPVRTLGMRRFDFRTDVAIMAVVNRTRDSFYDRGATFGLDAALAAARRAVAEGADLVDIGGVPFSPDAAPVTEAQEIERVIPVVEALVAEGIVVSVDTWRSAVANAAIAAGAAVINDTSGLHDPELAGIVADSDATLVLTHSLAAPGVHLRRPRYTDVVGEVRGFLADRIKRAEAAGVGAERLFIDPGPDLNKNTLHTLELCRRLDEIASLGLPMLAAVSNKDFIGEMLDRPRGERVIGTAVATALCVERGARIVRAHDVGACRDAVAMTRGILGTQQPAYLRHNQFAD